MVTFVFGGPPWTWSPKSSTLKASKLDRYVIPERRRVGHTPLAFLRVIGLATTMMTLGFFVVLPVVSVGVLLKKDPSRKWVSWLKRWREEGSELKIRFHKFKGGCSWKRWCFFFFGGGRRIWVDVLRMCHLFTRFRSGTSCVTCCKPPGGKNRLVRVMLWGFSILNTAPGCNLQLLPGVPEVKQAVSALDGIFFLFYFGKPGCFGKNNCYLISDSHFLGLGMLVEILWSVLY